jgi:hypothetical protein
MLELTGRVRNVLHTPSGTTKDGEQFGGYFQAQLEVEETLRNGESRFNFQNMRVEDEQSFKRLEGRLVRVEVGCFARNNQILFFLKRGSQPEDLGE